MASDEKLKVLYLQGYRQNEKVCKEKTGSLRKILKKHCDLVFITAPNVIPDPKDEEPLTGWWFSKPDQSYLAQEVTDCCDGFEKSLDVIAEALRDQGPFDGIFSFSQGASMLSMVCSLKEEGDPRFQRFNFAVLVAGFKSRQTQHRRYYERHVSIPSLHVIGDTDQVIPREMSDELLELYDDKVVVRHGGGHFIPTTSQQKKAYLEFLKPFYDAKNASPS